MRLGLVQLTSSDDPAANLAETLSFVRTAAEGGADLVATPEVTNCVSASRARQAEVLEREAGDRTLAAIRAVAASLRIRVLIGSLALKSSGTDARFVNRSFLVGPDGEIAARYDKLHMFDVEVSPEETYRESEGYRPGNEAVTAEADGVTIGLTICYDLRFPALYRSLAKEGAAILMVPSAFSPATGPAHWETLLRARAIENGAFVVAPAQTGAHRASQGRQRRSYGHSMVVDPWGEIIADAGTEPGVTLVDLDLGRVAEARRRIPSLQHDREFAGP